MTKEERTKAISYLQISAPVRAMAQEEFDKYIYLINEVIKILEQEPKSEWEHDHEILKAYSDGMNEVIDKIRAEIEEYKSRQLTLAIGVEDLEKGKQIAIEYILAIIDKYKEESEDK